MAALRMTRRRLERLRKLDMLLARGGYNLEQLADMLGVSYPTICIDKEFIQDNWWIERERDRSREFRTQRVREIEYIKRMALESYERSRKDVETTTSRFEDIKCPDCDGTKKGMGKGGVCIGCEGLGYTTEEVTVRTVAGKPGDSSFLNTALGAVKEIAKLEGLYEQPVQLIKHSIHGEVDVHVEHDLPFSNAPPELILKAMSVFTQLQEEARLAQRAASEKTLEAAGPPRIHENDDA